MRKIRGRVSEVSRSAPRRAGVIALSFFIAVLFLLRSSAEAQQAEKIPRVGILFIGSRNQPHLEAFKQGLREHGYIEGRNIVLEYRYAEGKEDRLPKLASELVQLKVNVIVVTARSSALAAQQATKTIPIVMTTGDPVSWGFAESLARPGGNVTGLTLVLADLSGKRLELLRDTVPKMTRVAALWSPREEAANAPFKETKAAAQGFSLQLQSFEVQTKEDIDKAFFEMGKVKPSALIVLLSPVVTLHSQLIVKSALTQQLPGIYPTRQFVEEGGLISYGPIIDDLYWRAAAYVDKILKGAQPAELPVEQPTKFEFVINLKTASQLGLTIPPNVLARADRVIR